MRGPGAQYISNKRPSRFVILSETKDLARRTEILRFTQDDTPETASFDWQHVLFEMYWALCLSSSGDEDLFESHRTLTHRGATRTGTRPPPFPSSPPVPTGREQTFSVIPSFGC